MIVDTSDRALLARGCALRVRDEGARAFLTFKGPVATGPLKVRQETETDAASAEALLHILASLGYLPVFRYEKFREEFEVPGAVVAIDETPIGTFVEIEGDEPAIHACAGKLGRVPEDYVAASYRTLFVSQGGSNTDDMTFDQARGRP